jgi:hypothetical protein
MRFKTRQNIQTFLNYRQFQIPHFKTNGTENMGKSPTDRLKESKCVRTGVPRGVVWGVQTPPPPKFRSFEKAGPNSQFRGI